MEVIGPGSPIMSVFPISDAASGDVLHPALFLDNLRVRGYQRSAPSGECDPKSIRQLVDKLETDDDVDVFLREPSGQHYEIWFKPSHPKYPELVLAVFIGKMQAGFEMHSKRPDLVQINAFIRDHMDYFEQPGDLKTLNISMYASKGVELTQTDINLEFPKIDDVIPELYPTVDVDELITQYLDAKESVLITLGEPGTGKTTLIRHILRRLAYEDEDSGVAYIKDTNIRDVGTFWPAMTRADHDVVIFDDLDGALYPRAPSVDRGETLMDGLLSFTDGIFSQLSSKNPKVVITTNQKVDRIDKALVRDGRCFDFLQFQPLDYEYARSVWSSVCGMTDDQFIDTWAKPRDITQAEFTTAMDRIKRGVPERTYVKVGPTKYTLAERLHELGIQPG